MNRQLSGLRILLVLCLALALACPEAHAWGGRGGYGGRYGGRGWHYYEGGRWYQRGWFWFDTAVTALTIGALVESLPPRYTTVVYAGAPYYYSDGYYYRPYQYGGYVVVAPPAIAQPVMAVPQPPPAAQVAPAPAAQPASDTVSINIPNSRGGYTSVTLKKAGNGWIGPQGEYYSENPTVEELKTLYGGR